MKLTNRLMACAEFVQKGNAVADIGTDHGYLPIYLLKYHICPSVIAADLRKQPLESAKRNADRAGIDEGIRFILSDGLAEIPVQEIQTIICAGMGGDCIQGILERKPEVWSPEYQFILQPQSSANVLRKWLWEYGFVIRIERLAQDGKFVYAVMDVSYGGGVPTAPGQHFVPDMLFEVNDPLLRPYFERVYGNLKRTVQGLMQSKRDIATDVLAYYQQALTELTEKGRDYGLCE